MSFNFLYIFLFSLQQEPINERLRTIETRVRALEAGAPSKHPFVIKKKEGKKGRKKGGKRKKEENKENGLQGKQLTTKSDASDFLSNFIIYGPGFLFIGLHMVRRRQPPLRRPSLAARTRRTSPARSVPGTRMTRAHSVPAWCRRAARSTPCWHHLSSESESLSGNAGMHAVNVLVIERKGKGVDEGEQANEV